MIRFALWLVLALHIAAAGTIHAGARAQSALNAALVSAQTANLPEGMLWSDICGLVADPGDNGAAERPICPFCVLHVATLAEGPGTIFPAPLPATTALLWPASDHIPHVPRSARANLIRRPPTVS